MSKNGVNRSVDTHRADKDSFTLISSGVKCPSCGVEMLNRKRRGGTVERYCPAYVCGYSEPG